jgi:two-component system, LytTR family, sensor kinase
MLETRMMTSEVRYWLVVGAVGWSAVTAIAFADMGLQRFLAGGGFFASAEEGVRVLLYVMPGILLSFAVVMLLRRIRVPDPGARPPVVGYVLIGIGFWLSWATIHSLLLQSGVGPADTMLPTLAQALGRSVTAHAFHTLILYSVIVVLFEATLYRREARQRDLRTAHLRSELARARTAALAARLDPHFLFNSLHVASGLMTRDQQTARKVLADLGELISAGVHHDGRDMVPLEEELRLVERYLRIQHARFGDRLRVEIDVDPAARRCRVPPLILQPLVENAIQHGIARTSEGGSLLVSGAIEGDRLRVEVVNTASARANPPPVRERIGLGGVRARLDLLFDGAASLDARATHSGDFKTRIELPMSHG